MNYLLWVVLPNISNVTTTTGIFVLIYVIIAYGYTLSHFRSNDEEIPAETNKTFKFPVIICAVLLGISCLTPSKKQLQTLVVVDTISHVKNIKELPDNTVELINAFIKSQTDKIKIKDKKTDD
jgi:hypothetical protein